MDKESKLNYIIVERSSEGDILIRTPFHSQWIEWMRKVPGLRKWIIPRTNEAIVLFCHYFKELPIEVKSPLLLSDFPQLLQLRNGSEFESIQRLITHIRQKGYSNSTKKAYIGQKNDHTFTSAKR
jgi:hypothetical protein